MVWANIWAAGLWGKKHSASANIFLVHTIEYASKKGCVDALGCP